MTKVRIHNIIYNWTKKLNKSQQLERRSYSRIPFTAEILMQTGNEEWSCNLLDISLKGMLVEPPDNLDIDLSNPCGMALFLGEDISIHARVNITRSSNGNWGLKWLQIDASSLQHLRRLIELNSDDPALLTRELSELG
jgi:c-di-GMP-binding flagellar brake protein YcgR